MLHEVEFGYGMRWSSRRQFTYGRPWQAYTQEQPPTSCGTAMCRCTSGRGSLLMPEGQMSLPGSSSRARSFLLPNSLATARASPSCLTTSVLPCRHLTITATRFGSRSLTSPTGRIGRTAIIPPSFRLSIRVSMRMLRRGYITTDFVTMSRIKEPTLARIR